MRKRIMLTVFVALMASSCQKKASGQTVAVVNGEEITASELNDALTSDNVAAGANTKEVRAAELQKLIDRKLMVQQARSDGLDKSPEFLNQQRRMTEDLLLNILIGKKLNTSQLPSANEIASYEAAHPQIFAGREIWTLDQIIYPISKDASVNAKLGAAKTLRRGRSNSDGEQYSIQSWLEKGRHGGLPERHLRADQPRRSGRAVHCAGCRQSRGERHFST